MHQPIPKTAAASLLLIALLIAGCSGRSGTTSLSVTHDPRNGGFARH